MAADPQLRADIYAYQDVVINPQLRADIFAYEILVAPSATAVNITGTARVGFTLTGNYTYNANGGDPEGASTYKWYRDDVAIGGATSITYLTVTADSGKTIKFGVTPVSTTPVTGTEVKSAGTAINTIPTATPSPKTFGANEGSLFSTIITFADPDELVSVILSREVGTPPAFVDEKIGITSIVSLFPVTRLAAGIPFDLTLTGTPGFADSGVYTWSYRITDTIGDFAIVNVTMTVTNVTPPAGQSKVKSLSAGVPFRGGVL